MGDISSPSDVTGTAIVSISAKIMISAVVFIFFIIVLLILLHLYAKWHYSTHPEDSTIVTWRRRTARQQAAAAAAAAQRKGLEAAALKSLPVVVYDPKDFKEGLECAVCLSELSEGEKARILPRCSHGFHAQCIDMWFNSHSTCPLCRTPVVSSQDIESKNDVEVQEDEYSISSSSDDEEDDSSHQATRLPTNVLFWGDETQVSSFGPGPSTSNGTSDVGRQRNHDLVIEIPRELCNDCLSSPVEEEKSPMMTTLRSLKRLLSRGKRVVPSPNNASSSGAMEQV